jgi:hypothetical protein
LPKGLPKCNTIAIILDVENISIDLARYAVEIAAKCSNKIIAVSDWTATPNIKGWAKFKEHKNIAFIQSTRINSNKNALDDVLHAAALSLLTEDVKQFIIASNDKDFINLAIDLQSHEAFVIGICTLSSSIKLRESFDKFLMFPPKDYLKLIADRIIPPGKPSDEVRSHLLEAYFAFTSGRNNWIKLGDLSTAFYRAHPDYVFPPDHPKQIKSSIKLYNETFDLKRNGNLLMLRAKT